MSDNIKPLVSVIVLTYNNFKRISETIISVLRQDYPNIELIIADDCSNTFPTELVNNVVNENRKSNLVNFCIINNVGRILAFFKYFPQLIRWICYCFSRGLAGYKDSKVIRNITLDDYKSFLS